MARHDLIKTGDADSFPQIEDRNGEVVLSYCRRCRQGEGELTESCPAGEMCNCENEHCNHKDGCKNPVDPSGAYRLMFVGGCCRECYYQMPERYRVLDGAQRRALIERKVDV